MQARGLTTGIDRYGASAPAEVLGEKFGFTAEAVTRKTASGWGERTVVTETTSIRKLFHPS